MWPHLITVGVAGKAISLGTDSAEVLTVLEPWRIEPVGEPIDYCLELQPEAAGPGAPRRLPGLYHGATALLRSADPARLTTAFLRVLGSYASAATEAEVRIALMPVVRDGFALLAPASTIGSVPDRWLTSSGIEAFHTVSSLVDATRGEVVVDPPLGSSEDRRRLTIAGWWLPSQYWDGDLSPGFAVAELMALATDVTAANARRVLEAVARLVERTHPTFAPEGVAAIKAGVVEVLGGAAAT